jgi:hypothetical protein
MQDLKKYLETSLKDIDSTYTLDSFRLIRVDTINQKMLWLEKAKNLQKDLSTTIEELKEANNMAQLEVHMMRVSRGVSESSYENAKEDYEKYMANAKELSVKGDDILKAHDSLIKLSEKPDSSKVSGYQAVVLYQLRRKDQSVKKDTGYIIMNTDKNIVKKEDFLDM